MSKEIIITYFKIKVNQNPEIIEFIKNNIITYFKIKVNQNDTISR